MVDLPAPRTPRGYALALVCLGNICRSPMAHVVLAHKLAAAGLASQVAVASSGTGDWHIGEKMDHRAAESLAHHGYDPTVHRGQQFVGDWFTRYDAILVMDAGNRRDVLRLTPADGDRERVLLFRAFDPEAGDDLDVPDPWYGDQRGFEAVLQIIERTTDELVTRLADP
ncbi:MAG: low molecular weight protein-tyrosine-phosphatase [Nocardioidaceae bacterium]